mmetsp:Transcript_26715/g.87614  ORF Transcript_26715/g.87614 Transcript_26715/m.87614 type:complete len:295 (+) Transcript_26715:6-890(+)
MHAGRVSPKQPALRRRNSARRGAATMAQPRAEIKPAVIVGGGRVGEALAKMNPAGTDVFMRRGESFPSDAPAEGPIYVCTRNDALEAVIEATPADRRGDLVFLQNGYLDSFLAEQGLADATQVLVYFAVAKLGDAPTDGVTDLNPEGLTAACGKYAEAMAERLHSNGLSCHVLEEKAFKASMLEKLIWISSFMLVGATHEGVSVGEVESEHTEELTALVNELAGAASELGVTLGPQLPERLRAYGRSVAHFPTAVKEFQWRNQFFYDISTKASSDPFPTHTALLEKAGVVPVKA